MDTKRLREILEKYTGDYMHAQFNDIVQQRHYEKTILDQAIKEIQELCGKLVEPMSSNYHDVDKFYPPNDEVGKLSTPHPTDWEKVEAIFEEQFGISLRECGLTEGVIKALKNNALSALKSMSEPRLMEECCMCNGTGSYWSNGNLVTPCDNCTGKKPSVRE